MLKKIFFICCSIFISIDIYSNTLSGCLDHFGRPIPTIQNNIIPIAAIMKNDSRLISLNPKEMNNFSKPFQAFAYWHECGHHMLGHLFTEKTVDIIQEQEADCMGIRIPLTIGAIKHDDIVKIEQELGKLGDGDWFHFSGKIRAKNIRKCLAHGYSQNVWPECKEKYYANLDFIKQITSLMLLTKENCKTLT